MVAAILLPTWIDKLGFSDKLVTVRSYLLQLVLQMMKFDHLDHTDDSFHLTN